MILSRTNSRARAEEAFKAQTHALGQERVASEQEMEAKARMEKTARLRALRLQKEADDASATEPSSTRRRSPRSSDR